ncbi:hypothetical protein [Wolbachia endosymbiont (group A) of Cydia strobilella]|uniref:hypothetical protein n=1 Tax=Wolbachia endosymbiont (group A) of Cydia strobilella TaxID=3066170 RepID=UPI0031333443
MTDGTILKQNHTSTCSVLEHKEGDRGLDDSFPFLLEQGYCFVEVPMLTTEDERRLFDEFHKEMQDIQKESSKEFQKTLNESNVDWTRSSLERIKCLVDRYL